MLSIDSLRTVVCVWGGTSYDGHSKCRIIVNTFNAKGKSSAKRNYYLDSRKPSLGNRNNRPCSYLITKRYTERCHPSLLYIYNIIIPSSGTSLGRKNNEFCCCCCCCCFLSNDKIRTLRNFNVFLFSIIDIFFLCLRPVRNIIRIDNRRN